MEALKKLHQIGPKIVVMSSTNIHSGEGKICLYASKQTEDSPMERYKIKVD